MAQGSINCYSLLASILCDICQKTAQSRFSTKEVQRCNNLGKQTSKQVRKASEKNREIRSTSTLSFKNQINQTNKKNPNKNANPANKITKPKRVASKLLKFPLNW